MPPPGTAGRRGEHPGDVRPSAPNSNRLWPPSLGGFRPRSPLPGTTWPRTTAPRLVNCSNRC
jgi:hypothetical protein